MQDKIDESIYLNFDKVLSFNAFLTMLIADRGIGKTFGAKKYCINHYIKKKKKFAWIRRYGTDLGETFGDAKEPNKFFKDIEVKFPAHTFTTENDERGKIKYCLMDDKIIGYGMNLKSAESLKGTQYNDVDTIILDEFLVGDGGSRYIKDEPMYLLSIIESIARMRKVRVILLGNSTSTVNPYFDFFDVHLPYESEYQLFKNNTILVACIKDNKYREAKKQTEFGKLIAGTKYERYAVENQFINDSSVFIKKKTPKSRLFCNIILNNTIYGVWMDQMDMYISKKYNQNYNVTITFDYKSHNEKTLLLKSKNVFMQNIVKHFQNATLYFENQQIKHAILDLLHRTSRFL